MKLHSLKPTPGSRRKPKVLGRGDGSGLGGTSGRGHKGDKARSGARIRLHFEGGQNTFFRRLPKRGFKSLEKKEYNVINLGLINKHFSASDVVDEKTLKDKGLIDENISGLKILGDGQIEKALTIKAEYFSATAKAKIEAAGGKCEVLAKKSEKPEKKS